MGALLASVAGGGEDWLARLITASASTATEDRRQDVPRLHPSWSPVARQIRADAAIGRASTAGNVTGGNVARRSCVELNAHVMLGILAHARRAGRLRPETSG